MSDRAVSVGASYGARADEYITALGSIEHAAGPDLALVSGWARRLSGPVADVGCGPGQWTHHLAGLGADVHGIDPIPAFIAHARVAYPGVDFRIGRAEDLGVDDGALGGILAWYSLIHTAPSEIGAPLSEFARCLRPGGGLALGFFTGPALEPFDHAITTAYRWPIDVLAAEIENAGFDVAHTETRTDPGVRPHGAILAERRTGSAA